MAAEWEKRAASGEWGEDIYDLFDRVDTRLIEEKIWEAFGLGDEDEVPVGFDRLIMPKFEINEEEKHE